jgi:hypothetical protein
VFALFYEDDFILIAAGEKDSQATAPGVISRERRRPVIVAWNDGDGSTRISKFEDGGRATDLPHALAGKCGLTP